MTPTVKAEKIEGVSVYGLPQYEYTLEGTTGRFLFSAVVTEASFQQAAAVEEQVLATAAALKIRRRKLEDYGKALSIFAKLAPNLPGGKSQTSSDMVKIEWDEGGREYCDFFGKIKAIYGLEINFSDKYEKLVYTGYSATPQRIEVPAFCISRGELQKAQAKMEDSIERDNNGMQQEMTTLDGYVTKRDKSFAVAEKVIKKFGSAADNTIRAMM